MKLLTRFPILLLAFVGLFAQAGATMAGDYQAYAVKAADGVSLSVREWGNPSGPEIVFVHGLAQSQLAFLKQTRSELAKTFRMITYDVRGHGESSKPTDPAHYVDGRRWADDLQAVIDAAKLKRPVLVGWSLGGIVIAQYLAVYGDTRLAGINLVSARIVVDPARNTLGPGGKFLAPMLSPDLETSIPATAGWVRAMFNRPLSLEEFELWFAFNMVTRNYVLAATLKLPRNFVPALEKVSVPVLLTHGKADQVVLPEASKQTASAIKAVRVSLYEDAGHAVFWESPGRFNAELAEFVGQSWRQQSGPPTKP